MTNTAPGMGGVWPRFKRLTPLRQVLSAGGIAVLAVIVTLMIVGAFLPQTSNTPSGPAGSDRRTSSPLSTEVVTVSPAPTATVAPQTASPTPTATQQAANATPRLATSKPKTPKPATPKPKTSRPATPKPAVACAPLTNAGNCYKPGQLCRKTDRNVSGIDGAGRRIHCIDKNGWRWIAY